MEDLTELQELNRLSVSAIAVEQAALVVLTYWPETLRKYGLGSPAHG